MTVTLSSVGDTRACMPPVPERRHAVSRHRSSRVAQIGYGRAVDMTPQAKDALVILEAGWTSLDTVTVCPSGRHDA